MAKSILDSLDNTSLEILRRPIPRDGCPAHSEVDNLRDSKYPHQDRDQIKAIPEVHHAHIEAQRAGLALLADGGQQQAQQAHGKSPDLAARAQTAERSDASDPHHGKHQELRRAETQNQRTNNGDRQSQNQRSDQGSDERTHERGAQSPAGFSILGHWIAVHYCGCRYRLARNAEENRGNISGCGGNGVHAEQKGERLRRAHLENERQHHSERRGAADAGK